MQKPGPLPGAKPPAPRCPAALAGPVVSVRPRPALLPEVRVSPACAAPGQAPLAHAGHSGEDARPPLCPLAPAGGSGRRGAPGARAYLPCTTQRRGPAWVRAAGGEGAPGHPRCWEARAAAAAAGCEAVTALSLMSANEGPAGLGAHSAAGRLLPPPLQLGASPGRVQLGAPVWALGCNLPPSPGSRRSGQAGRYHPRMPCSPPPADSGAGFRLFLLQCSPWELGPLPGTRPSPNEFPQVALPSRSSLPTARQTRLHLTPGYKA